MIAFSAVLVANYKPVNQFMKSIFQISRDKKSIKLLQTSKAPSK